jgi:RNA polymerase sigma-70 factor (ECF subfamily)
VKEGKNMDRNEEFTRNWTKAQPMVAGYVNSLVPDFHKAEDILQEVAVVLWKKYKEYDKKRSFTSWAVGIARLEILSSKRDFARHHLAALPDAVDTITETYNEMTSELEARAQALKECVRKVKGGSQRVLKLRYENNLKPQKIAQSIGKEAGAVRVMLSRIRDALKKCVENWLAAHGLGEIA